jgi:hypothetical protein
MALTQSRFSGSCETQGYANPFPTKCWDREFADSPLEESGFEPSVPHRMATASRLFLPLARCPLLQDGPFFDKEPAEFRSWLPLAGTQYLARIRLLASAGPATLLFM